MLERLRKPVTLCYIEKINQQILIENKDWTRPIVNAEVQKFVRDVEIQKCHGLFLSQNVGICSKDNYEINILEGNLVTVYIHNVNYDQEKNKCWSRYY